MDFDRLGLQARKTHPIAAGARVLATGVLCAFLAACGGGSDPASAAPPLPVVLAGAPANGPATDSLPAGAREVSVADLERMAAAGDELLWFTPASKAAVGNSDAARRQAARAAAEATLAALMASLEDEPERAAALARAFGAGPSVLPTAPLDLGVHNWACFATPAQRLCRLNPAQATPA